MTNIENKIKNIIEGLKIPESMVEDAAQEGYLAYYEKRDLQEAIRYWYEKELEFQAKHSLEL